MDILIGLLIIAIGSFCQSSSYVPIKKYCCPLKLFEPKN